MSRETPAKMCIRDRLKEGQIRIPSGCAISGVIDLEGGSVCGEEMIRSISVMHDRSNGLGGGFAGYGIYPQYKNLYAFHVFYEDQSAREECEKFLDRHFDIVNLSKIPTRKHPRITDAPLLWRYFLTPLATRLSHSQLDEREYVVRCVTRVNTRMKGAHIFSKMCIRDSRSRWNTVISRTPNISYSVRSSIAARHPPAREAARKSGRSRKCFSSRSTASPMARVKKMF